MLPKFLTADYPIEKQLFLAPKFALGMVGMYPESRLRGWVLFWALVNLFVLAYGDYAEFAYGVHYLSIDVVQALDAFCPVASSIMAVVKISVIWRYHDKFQHMIEQLRALTEAQQGASKLKIKQRHYLIATRLPFTVVFFGIFTSTAYSLRPIIRNVYGHMQGREFIYETPFNMIFPHFLLSMPMYPLTFLFSHWHGYATVLAFAGTVGLFLGCCLYFTTLLECLQVDLKEVLCDQDALPVTQRKKASTEADTMARLQRIIERHNEIADLLRDFSLLNSEITLALFIVSSVTICMCIIDILLFSGYGAVLYVVHTCAVSSELFLYCFAGSAVMESSQELATVAYSSHWYTHSVKVQKMVLMLMIRAQRSFIVKVPFFAPSLPVFTSMLRFSGSLIALLRSVL